MQNDVNAIIDAISIIMVAVVFISNMRRGGQYGGVSRLLNILMLCVGAVLLLDMPAWILDGKDFRSARAICMTLNTAYYLAQIIYCRLWLIYVDYWIRGTYKRSPLTRIVFSIPMALEMIIIFANIKTGAIFTVSADNVYTRGAMYAVNLIPYFYYILSAVGFATYGVIKNRHTEKYRQNKAILAYMFLPICGAVIQSIGYGASWLWPFTAISLLMIYMNLQEQRISDESVAAATEAAKVSELENELTDSRVKIMLSQIKPHFLYNSLSVIQALCETEPEVAARAIEDFAVYLRCNMDSLGSDALIPFEKELSHTERYLSLEKLRFQDRLAVEYDLKARDFALPALSVQPIAENAVRYGITKRDEGGRLKISTRETESGYEISVEDNGIGFEPTDGDDDGTHIGIANVGRRLATLCGGKIEVKSTAGVGTKAVITIPKSEGEKIK